MNSVKKTVKGALESGLEALKDSVKEGGKEIVQTVNPIELVKTALNTGDTNSAPNEIGEYLKNLAPPSLQTKEAIESREQEEKVKTEQETERLRNILHGKQTAPVPSNVGEERVYDKLWRERQEKEAAEAQAKGQQGFIDAPSRKKLKPGQTAQPKSSGMETKQNIKTG